MLSPNPPPSVIESNGQNFSTTAPNTLASGQSTTATVNPNINNSSTVSNLNNNSGSNNNINNTTSTNTTNVIINNIKTNTTTIGTTNLDSGIVQPSTTTDGEEATTKCNKNDKSESNIRNRWHTCPELHKAMDGVTYIADHTKKEEESTRVSIKNLRFQIWI